MKNKKRYIARLDEVTISRDNDVAIISYLEKGVPGTNLEIGPKILQMSNQEILDLHNECLRVQAQRAANFKFVAVEVPLNSPQIKYFKPGEQWVPRGDVLRCMLHDDEDGRVVVQIDDKELSLEQFGRLLLTQVGWGMRVEFVPEDALHRRPSRQVREPTAEEHDD